MRTSTATIRRMANYDAAVRFAEPMIREAYSLGAGTRCRVAAHLNELSIPAPAGGRWSLYAVGRAERRLAELKTGKAITSFKRQVTRYRLAG